MSELEWAVFFDKLIWFGVLLLPIGTTITTLLIARRPHVDTIRAGSIGTFSTLALGAAGSYAIGASVIGVIMGSGDIPYYLVAEAWHRVWFPLGISLIGASLIMIYTLSVNPSSE